MLTPTPEDRHAVWLSVTADGATVGEMGGSEKLKHRRLIHIKHMMAEALGKQSFRWGSLLRERPRVEYEARDDA
jgi:hypothetical protein